MKKITFLALLAFAFSGKAFAQTCKPDTSIKATGVYPDTLPKAIVNVPYNEVLQFKFPKDSNYMGFNVPIDSVFIDSVKGFPDTGFKYVFNKKTWYRGGENGCATLTGNPLTKEIGSYKVRVYLKIIATILGKAIPDTASYAVPFQVIGTAGINNNSSSLIKTQNFPNPFNTTTEISYTSEAPSQASFRVCDMLGKPVYEKQLSAIEGLNTIIFSRGSLPSGLYFYNIALGSNTVSRCMMIKN